MKTKTTIMQWGLSLLAAITLVPTVNAVVINFAVTHPDDISNVTSTNLSGPNGVVAGVETWNLASNNGASTLASVSGLLDAAAATTGVGVSFSGIGGPDDWGYNSALKLLWRSGRNFDTTAGNSASFTISGVAPGLYDLWIATSHRGEATTGTWSTTNTNTTGASLAFDNSADPSNGSTWVLGSTYELFQNMEPTIGGSITMTVQSAVGKRVGFNGFQLVSVPEPSSAALLGLGAFALILRRRK